jgi:hypothetical protein
MNDIQLPCRMLHRAYFDTRRIPDTNVADGQKNASTRANTNNTYALPSLRTSVICARNVCARFQNDYDGGNAHIPSVVNPILRATE